jgi:Protein of unknown function (DUF742)
MTPVSPEYSNEQPPPAFVDSAFGAQPFAPPLVPQEAVRETISEQSIGEGSSFEVDPGLDEAPSMVRSFLGRTLRSGPESEFDERTFRPFLVTGGRTTSEFPLDFEAMVTPTPAGLCADLRFEQRTMLDRCIQSGAQSIAELAAYLKLPIGTVRVVAADLVSSHLLDVHSPDKNLSNDVLMLKRLINGVRAL